MMRLCRAPWLPKATAFAAVAFGAACILPFGGTLPPCDSSSAMPALDGRSIVKVLAVGDVAECPGGSQGQVSDLALALHPDLLLALGDLAYPNGSIEDYLSCYGPSFGRLRPMTRAVPGNHDYHTVHAGAYYAYFCGSSGDPFKGYYSFDVGHWHIVALNSNCGEDPDVPAEVTSDFGGCRDDSPQLAWLRADIAAHPTGCRAAMWHHPRHSQSSEGSSPSMEPAWRLLADAKFDIVLNGHAHNYQRYPALDGNGEHDDTYGLREFVVGTGGSGFSEFESREQRSDARNASSHGLLELDLGETDYRWHFRAIAGDTFSDDGVAKCHL